MKKISTEKIFFITIGFFVFLILIAFLFARKAELQLFDLTKMYVSPDTRLSQTINIEAKGYVIYDLNSEKILKSENATTSFALASLSKVIIIGAYLDYKSAHNEAIDADGYAYIQKILVESDNVAIEDLNKRFVDKNGVSLIQLGMELSTRLGYPNEIILTNPSGLDIDESRASNFGTPRAVAALYSYLYKTYPNVFQKTKFAEVNNGEENLINTNKTSDQTFGILSSKTGFTDVAGGNLAVTVAPAPGSEYLLIVFKSSKQGRFADIQKLNTLLPVLLKID